MSLFFVKEGQPLTVDAVVEPSEKSGKPIYGGVSYTQVLPVQFVPQTGRSSAAFVRAVRTYFTALVRGADALCCRSVALRLPFDLDACTVSEISSAGLDRIILAADTDVYIIVSEGERDGLSLLIHPNVPRYSCTAPAMLSRRMMESLPDCGSMPADDFCDEERVCSSASVSFDECDDLPESLIALLRSVDDGFAVTLLKLIDAKGMDDVACYKAANVSRQTWYKIMNDPDYRPSKNTVLSFAIALRLTVEETRALLATVGLALSPSSRFDITVEFFISEGVYDLFTINAALFALDLEPLGTV